MKSLIKIIVKKLNNCLKLRHPFCVLFIGVCISFSYSLNATDNKKESNTLSRKPSAVEEEILTVPIIQNESFFTNENMFAEDDAGVMRDLKASMRSWESTEEFARVWDLGDTGLYTTPTTAQKSQFILKKMLRYADKRLSGEMKRAEEGSTLHSMSRVEKNLRPNATVNVSKNFGFKFKARVLQGKFIVDVKNPWVECNATLSANGKARVMTRKDFKEVGLSSGAEYSINESSLLTYIDQQVTDNVKARVSNTSGDNADSRLEMMASFPFNL